MHYQKAAYRQQYLKVAIADRIATIPAYRPQDHITLEMAQLEIRHRSVRPNSAKHAQASRILQQNPSSRYLARSRVLPSPTLRSELHGQEPPGAGNSRGRRTATSSTTHYIHSAAVT